MGRFRNPDCNPVFLDHTLHERRAARMVGPWIYDPALHIQSCVMVISYTLDL